MRQAHGSSPKQLGECTPAALRILCSTQCNAGAAQPSRHAISADMAAPGPNPAFHPRSCAGPAPAVQVTACAVAHRLAWWSCSPVARAACCAWVAGGRHQVWWAPGWGGTGRALPREAWWYPATPRHHPCTPLRQQAAANAGDVAGSAGAEDAVGAAGWSPACLARKARLRPGAHVPVLGGAAAAARLRRVSHAGAYA